MNAPLRVAAAACSTCDDELLVPDGAGERECCTCAAYCRKCREPRKKAELSEGFCLGCVVAAAEALTELTHVECNEDDGLDQLRAEAPRSLFTSIPGVA